MRATWKARARAFEVDVYALYLACRDPRVPWYAKAAAGCVVAYAFSPVDVIPDFVPIVGYLDDLVLVPLGVIAVRRLIPAPLWADCRARAAQATKSVKPRLWIGAAVIVAVWLAVIVAVAAWLFRRFAG